jgi:ParB/RepB/Spo0J family partition protein
MNVKTLPIDSISFSTNRPYGGEGDIKILAEDIKHNGLINPITVKARLNMEEELEYEVSAGRRRLAAVKLLGWGEIPVRILEGDEAERAGEIALSENVNRLAMHPLDEAVYYKRLIENGEPIQTIAERSDRKVPEIYQRIRLLSLEPAVQELFKAGKLSLAAAAMLADLDAGQQGMFVEQEGDKQYYGDMIPDYVARNFISSLYHDKLYSLITGKECAGCKKRTVYTDKSLFPDFDGGLDSCLDHACYLDRWRKILEKEIKAAVKEHPELTGVRMLVINDNDIRKIFGNTLSLGPDEYQVKPWSWETDAEKPGKDTAPALRMTAAGKIKIELMYRREKPPKEKESADSGFKPALKLLDLPKEEQKAAVEALKSKKISHYEFNGTVRERVFRRLLEAKAAHPAEQNDVEYFIKNFVFKDRYERELDKDEKKTFGLIMGYEYDGDAGRLLQAPWEKLCVLMAALRMDEHGIPDVDDFEAGKNRRHLDWFPVSDEEAREIYREEIRALLPKSKAEKKAAGKKTAAKKPAKAGAGKK